MKTVTQRCMTAGLILGFLAAPLLSAAKDFAESEEKVLALAKAAISLRSVRGWIIKPQRSQPCFGTPCSMAAGRTRTSTSYPSTTRLTLSRLGRDLIQA